MVVFKDKFLVAVYCKNFLFKNFYNQEYKKNKQTATKNYNIKFLVVFCIFFNLTQKRKKNNLKQKI